MRYFGHKAVAATHLAVIPTPHVPDFVETVRAALGVGGADAVTEVFALWPSAAVALLGRVSKVDLAL